MKGFFGRGAAGGGTGGGACLPDGDRALAETARALAGHAAAVLLSNRSALLTLTLTFATTTGTDRSRLDIACWSGLTTVSSPWLPLSGEGGRDDPVLTALERSGRRLIADLLPRWPANTRPPAIGIVTDGHGVAFSPDHPSPIGTGWLGWHLGGACATTTLLPFAPTSCWTGLIAPVESQRLN